MNGTMRHGGARLPPPRNARAIVAALVFAIPLSAAHAKDSSADRMDALVQAGYEADGDDFSGLLLRSGLLLDYQSPLQHAGFAIQDTRYSHDDWSKDVPAVVGIYRNQQRGTLTGPRAEAGVASVAGHLRPVGDVTLSLRPRETTGVELIAAGDVIGTRAAIDRGITYGLAAASLEQQFGERVTGIVLAGYQPFTDGNSRNLLRARLIGAVRPELGLSLQARWRQYTSSADDIDAYFNPGHYRNWDAGLAMRRHFQGWAVSGVAGAGRERIDDQPWKDTAIAELHLEGALASDKRLTVNLIYMRAAGFATEPDYWYGAVNVALSFPVRR